MIAREDYIGSPDQDVNDYEYVQDLAAGLIVRPTEEENR